MKILIQSIHYSYIVGYYEMEEFKIKLAKAVDLPFGEALDYKRKNKDNPYAPYECLQFINKRMEDIEAQEALNMEFMNYIFSDIKKGRLDHRECEQILQCTLNLKDKTKDTPKLNINNFNMLLQDCIMNSTSLIWGEYNEFR